MVEIDGFNMAKTIYLRAMARGGGNNDTQAAELLQLPDDEFNLALQFIACLAVNPTLFKAVATEINAIHTAINARRTSVQRLAPVNLVARNVWCDMIDTLVTARSASGDDQRERQLNIAVEAINKIKPDQFELSLKQDVSSPRKFGALQNIANFVHGFFAKFT